MRQKISALSECAAPQSTLDTVKMMIELSMTCMSAARTTAKAMMYLWGSPRVWGNGMTAASLTALPLAFSSLGAGFEAPVLGLFLLGAPLGEGLLEGGDDGGFDVVDG